MSEQENKDRARSLRCHLCGRQFERFDDLLAHPCTRPAAQPGPGLLASSARFLYTQNPFYLISAALILYGLNTALGASSTAASAWALLGILAVYTLLMLATALLIVRFGKVWQDARSLLLVIVLLLLALSVSFDEILLRAPGTGRTLLLLGLLFSVLVSESVLECLGIRLRTWFRVPWCAMLGLFFAYPLALQPLVRLEGTGEIEAQWGAFLFPVAAALALLLLLPAIHKGADYAKENGTPWRWPWFPWSLFVLLLFGIGVRSYYLTLSFHVAVPVGLDSIFGLYFLAPIVLAAAVLLLEAGLVSRKPAVQFAALALPALAVLFSLTAGEGTTWTYNHFLRMFTSAFGPPIFVTALAVSAFYVYACVRRVRFAPHALALALILCTGAVPGKVSGIAIPAPALPLFALGVLFTWFVVIRRFSVFALLAVGAFLAAFAVAFPGTWFTRWHGLIPVHLAYVAALLIGALFRDQAARVIQHVSAAVLLPAVVIVLATRPEFARLTAPCVPWIYVGVLVVLSFIYGLLVRNSTWLAVGVAGFALLAVWAMALLYKALAVAYGSDATLPFFGSTVAFLIAFIISLTKFGQGVRRLYEAVTRPYRRTTAVPPPLPGQ